MKSRLLIETLLLLSVVAAPTMLVGGEKTHFRGWIGGEYRLAKKSGFFQRRATIPAFPRSVTNQTPRGIFVAAVPTNTPAATAGLQAGDLILQADNAVLKSVRDWRELIDKSAPGRILPLSVWRLGEHKQVNVVVGRESYRNMGGFGIGIYLSSRLDAIPNPNFSLVALGFRRDSKRVELNSPKQEYLRAAQKKNPDAPDVVGGTDSEEGWKAWLTPFHLSWNRRIINQESVPAPTAWLDQRAGTTN